MKRGWQVACVGFLALSLLVIVESLQFPLTDPLGPGPGFFPFWLSLLSGGLAVMLFVQVSRGKIDPVAAGLIPDRAAGMRVLRILAGLAGATLLLDPLGFRLTLLLFIVYLLVALGVRRWWLVAVVALAGSFGVFHVFYYWLRVPLPIGALGI
jgi:putative tricarboxylic transport membrane protein